MTMFPQDSQVAATQAPLRAQIHAAAAKLRLIDIVLLAGLAMCASSVRIATAQTASARPARSSVTVGAHGAANLPAIKAAR